MGKLRVICSDPYATDSSSDDEEQIEPKRSTNGRRFVHVISLFPSIDQLSLDAPDSSSREDHPAKDVPICINEETSYAVGENSSSLEKERHLGVKKTSSGKWEVQIHNPMEGTTLNLGSYNTFEEATDTYEEKNLELTLLSNLIKLKKPIVQSQKAKRRLQKFELHNLNISETATGKWGAYYKNPSSKVKVWMGIYATPEEAIISYCKKKAEFESSSNPKKTEKKGKTSSPAQDTEIAGLNRPGINQTKTGRYGVFVYHECMKTHHWLGYYDTAEEAAAAFDKKKAELEAKVVNEERCSRGKKKKTDSRKVVIHPQGQIDAQPYKCIRLRKSGRWAAEIKDPIKRKNTHIGTYDTPEEAANAYSKRKRELEEMVLLTKKQKCNGNNASPEFRIEAANSTITAVNSQNSEESNRNNNNENCSVINAAEINDPIKRKNTHIGTYDTPEEAVRKCELEEMVLLTKKQKCNSNNASPKFPIEADNSTITAVSSQNNEESNRNNNNENCTVINSCGELIGAYSWIDDELWLTGPGDSDECVVNGTIGGIEGDVALDQKLF